MLSLNATFPVVGSLWTSSGFMLRRLTLMVTTSLARRKPDWLRWVSVSVLKTLARLLPLLPRWPVFVFSWPGLLSKIGISSNLTAKPLSCTRTFVTRFIAADESLIELAVYFRNWHMFREYMNNIAC